MGRGGTGGNASAGLLPLDSKHPDFDLIFRTGNIEDDYDVEKEPIARGKFASVRLAHHRTTGVVFAAKFVRRRRRAANLEEEARHEVAVLLLGRSTPHIVHLHQVYETRSEYIIILEFGEGGDLQRLLDEQGSLQEKSVRDLLRQVLRGLGYLHDQHVAHLDIKPQNLVLMGASSEDIVKLVDFGLSRVIHQDTELTHIMGTPDYVAPEVINFEPVGLATDMWSIGVLTYVLLTGYTPFGGDTDQETFVNITQGEFDFPEEYFGDVSDQAKDFISGLLIKSTNQRMTVMQCVAHPWLSDLFDPHRLSQLSEADSADSGYSTDLCSGSPPSPGSLPNGFVSDLCQFSIPEDQQLSTHQPIHSYNKQFRPHQLRRLGEDEVDRGESSDRRPRLSAAHMSISVLECLQSQQRPQQSRPLRRSSLVIPRYTNDYDAQPMFRDSNPHNGVPYFEYDENQNTNSAYPSNNHFDYGLPSNLNSWNQPQISASKGKGLSTKNPIDQNALLNIAKPWNNLCYGSYSRALNQLKSSPKKGKQKTNLGLRPELSCSMFELKPNNENSSLYSDLKSPKYDLRKSKSELRASKKDLRAKNLEMGNSRSELRSSRNDIRGSMLELKSPEFNHRSSNSDVRGSISDVRGSISDIRVSKSDLRGSISDIRGSKSDLRGSISDIRGSKSDIRGSKSDLRGSKHDLRGSRYDLRNSKSELRMSNKEKISAAKSNLLSSHNFVSIPYLNMSLSSLDIAHETLDNDESEERDVVYGDCTLPRRFSRNNPNVSPLLRGSSFHMSFRRPKKRDNI